MMEFGLYVGSRKLHLFFTEIRLFHDTKSNQIRCRSSQSHFFAMGDNELLLWNCLLNGDKNMVDGKSAFT